MPETFWWMKPMDWRMSITRGKSSADQEVHILRVPHGLLVHPGNPGSYGVTSDDDVGDAGLLHAPAARQVALANCFHCGYHPFPGEILENNGTHDIRSGSGSPPLCSRRWIVPAIPRRAIHHDIP